MIDGVDDDSMPAATTNPSQRVPELSDGEMSCLHVLLDAHDLGEDTIAQIEGRPYAGEIIRAVRLMQHLVQTRNALYREIVIIALKDRDDPSAPRLEQLMWKIDRQILSADDMVLQLVMRSKSFELSPHTIKQS